MKVVICESKNFYAVALLNLANSMWFNKAKRFQVNHDFLQLNADYYGADVYQQAFNEKTRQEINGWVSEKTDEMILEILNEIPKEAVFYLINALAFEAEWEKTYEKEDVKEGIFTLEDGTEQKVQFMYSQESGYVRTENAIGFLKYYKDRKYAFMGLLPYVGVSVEEVVNSLNGEELQKMLLGLSRGGSAVYAAIPKFEIEYGAEMSEILQNMGMSDAFLAESADLSGIGTSSGGNVYINRILHKTFISVDEKGTKAGATTVVEGVDLSGPSSIYLDRPFVYLLIDCENNIPFFMGTMMDLNGSAK